MLYATMIDRNSKVYIICDPIYFQKENIMVLPAIKYKGELFTPQDVRFTYLDMLAYIDDIDKRHNDNPYIPNRYNLRYR